MLKVYLDNDVASAISRRDLDKAELEAIDQLLEAKRSGNLDLGTSRQSPREMERAPSQHRAKLKTGLSEVAEAEDDHKVLGFHTQTDQYGGCITNRWLQILSMINCTRICLPPDWKTTMQST